jgi:hypothetical protein
VSLRARACSLHGPSGTIIGGAGTKQEMLEWLGLSTSDEFITWDVSGGFQ